MELAIILDELKQFVIKRLNNLDEFNQSNNYIVIYENDYCPKKISSIVLLCNLKNYKVVDNKITYINEDDVEVFLTGYENIFEIDKKIDFSHLVNIKNNIIYNMNNSGLITKANIEIHNFWGGNYEITAFDKNIYKIFF